MKRYVYVHYVAFIVLKHTGMLNLQLPLQKQYDKIFDSIHLCIILLSYTAQPFQNMMKPNLKRLFKTSINMCVNIPTVSHNICPSLYNTILPG